MAVAKLKCVDLIAPADKIYDTAKIILDFNDMHLINISIPPHQKNHFKRFIGENKYKKTIKDIQTLSQISDIKLDKAYNSEVEVEDVSEYIIQLTEDYKHLKETKLMLEQKIINEENTLLQLGHLQNMDVNLDNLFSLRFIKFRFGRLTRQDYDHLKLYDSPLFVYIPSSIENNYVWGMYFVSNEDEEKVDDIFYKLGFERVRISGEAKGTVEQSIKTLTELNAHHKEYLANIDCQIKNFDIKYTDKIKALYAHLERESKIFEIQKYAIISESLCIFSAWVPANKVADLEKQVHTVENAYISIEDNPSEPTPTKLKNNFFTKAFSNFVLMSGVPNPKELDPSAFMAMLFCVLFGVMAGDVGQGIIMVLAGFVYSKWKKNSQTGKFLMMLGASSTVFGFVYGSVFGFEDVLKGWFRPMENVNTMLGYSIIIGVICISLAIIINIINGIKQKDFEKILFSNNGLIGLVFYWALAYGVSDLLIFNGEKRAFSHWWFNVFLLLTPAVIIFFREPLSHLISRKRHKEKIKIGEFILSNVFELFEFCLAYITNTISFLRVAAFAIIHASMMNTVFMFAGAHNGSPNILVIILGNLFVLSFEGLIAGIQSLRLNLYEMFSRFFIGDGILFEDIKTKFDV